jgi:hypothetical protein
VAGYFASLDLKKEAHGIRGKTQKDKYDYIENKM